LANGIDVGQWIKYEKKILIWIAVCCPTHTHTHTHTHMSISSN